MASPRVRRTRKAARVAPAIMEAQPVSASPAPAPAPKVKKGKNSSAKKAD